MAAESPKAGRWKKVRSVVKTASAVQAFCRIRVGLQDDKSTVKEKLTTIIEKMGIQVSHKAGDATKVLSKQGNPELYTQTYLAQRAHLRADPRVKEAIFTLWDTDVSLSHFRYVESRCVVVLLAHENVFVDEISNQECINIAPTMQLGPKPAAAKRRPVYEKERVHNLSPASSKEIGRQT